MDRYATAPRPGRARARFVRVVPGETAARTMIMWIPQLISCGIHMKSEIPLEPSRPACGRRGQPAHSPHGHHAPLKSAASARQGPKYPALRVGAALGVPGRCARLGSRPEVSHAVRVPAHIVSRTAHVRHALSAAPRPARTVSRPPRPAHTVSRPPTSGTDCQPAPASGTRCQPAPHVRHALSAGPRVPVAPLAFPRPAAGNRTLPESAAVVRDDPDDRRRKPFARCAAPPHNRCVLSPVDGEWLGALRSIPSAALR